MMGRCTGFFWRGGGLWRGATIEGDVTIIARATELLGDEPRAIAWFRFQPLPGFDGKTAEELVAEGQAEAVLNHLDALENGGFA